MAHEIEKKAEGFLKENEAFEVKNIEDYKRGALLITAVKELLREVDKTFNPIIESAKATLQTAKDQKSIHATPLNNFSGAIVEKMFAWKKIEDQRIAEEREAEQKKMQASVQESRLKQAIKAEESGDQKKAEAILNRPMSGGGRSAATPATTEKVKGFSTRKQPSFRIVDENLIPKQYWILDNQAINGVIKALKEKHGIPGLEYFEEEVPVRR